MKSINKSISCVSKSICSGCGLCVYKCPKNAISLIEDECGFLYPIVDKSLCSNCGLCFKSCIKIYNSFNAEPEFCNAVMSSDEIRIKSSSGGAFFVLASYFLDNGGYVVGAAFDENFYVKHIMISDKRDLYSLLGSKYVQSDIRDIFPKIKEKLDSDADVLFSGTPCQVAALKSFLNKDYKKLTTIDLICNGVPSNKIFKTYLSEKYNISNIKSISFRNKKHGWNYNFVFKVIYFDGTSVDLDFNDCSYLTAFNSGISVRESCCNCRYAKPTRVADITLGDFWEIANIEEYLDDRIGSSCVVVNSEKGGTLLSKVKNNFPVFSQIEYKLAQKWNSRLTTPVFSHPSRGIFFRNLNQSKFDTNVLNCFTHKYDAVILNMWWSNNYGACLTAYALQQMLKKLGYDSLLANYVYQNKNGFDNSLSDKFARKYLRTTKKLLNQKDLIKLNELTNTFIVGSDQVFRYDYLDNSYFLDFVPRKAKKIAFSASFGISTFNCPTEELESYRYLLSRFDYVSVRERSGINIVNETLKRDQVDYIIDPVFCIKDEYNIIADNSELSIKEEPYLLVYILDTNEKKVHFVNEILKSLRVDVKYVTSSTTVEDWLFLLKNAFYIITDSFHGACFSLIFQKPFLTIINKERGADRFYQLEEIFNLPKGIFLDFSENVSFNGFQYIDYEYISELTKEYVNRAYITLKKELEKSKDCDELLDDISYISQLKKKPSRISDIQEKIEKIINYLIGNDVNLISIYGAGEICDEFLNISNQHNINVRVIFDSKAEAGEYFRYGFTIKKLQERLINDGDYIVIASESFKEEIISKITNTLKQTTKKVNLITL